LKRAVLAPPMWRWPVGLGANLTRIFPVSGNILSLANI
jgi:hypothetical protein